MEVRAQHNGEIIKTKNKKTAEETLQWVQYSRGTTTSATEVSRKVLNESQGYHSEPGAEAIGHLNYSIVSRTRHYSVVSLVPKNEETLR